MENMESDGTKSNETSTEKSAEKDNSNGGKSLNTELKIVEKETKSGVINENSANQSNEKDTNADTSLDVEIDINAKDKDKVSKFTMGDIIEHSDKLQLLTSDDEDGDDVPGDFFDDFLKEDFMAGLDVVDDDDWVHKKNDEDKTLTPEKQDKEKVKNIEKTNKKAKQKEDKSTKSFRNRIKSTDLGIHRDPKKTKRDIELDKARCEKDKEMKRISDKLKLVETGLVPPGMEMETDIEAIENQKEPERKDMYVSQNKQDSSVRKKSNSPKGQIPTKSSPKSNRCASKSPLRSITTPKRGRHESPNSRNRRETSQKSYGTRLSPKSRDRRELSQKLHNRRLSSKSPYRRELSQKARDRRLSPKSRDRLELSQKPRDRRLSPRSRDRPDSSLKSRNRRESPRRSRDRYKSLGRRESPKRSHRLDSPLRSRDRRGRSRDRRSKERSRSHSRDRFRSSSRILKRKREEKMSFLQEIAEKLRNPGSFQSYAPQEIHHIGPQISTPIPIPTPVPAPPLSTQYPIQQRYDQNYFIGTPHTNILQSQTIHYQVGLHGQMQDQVPIHQQAINQQQFNTPMQLNFSQPHVQNNLGFNTNVEPQNEFKTKDDLQKLYEDKKITLVDFLAITAKPEVYSASPTQMKEKIKVISRCQDAIKYLGNMEKHFTGPLILQRNNDTSMLSQEKFKSPLLQSTQVKLPFTEIPNTAQQNSKLFTRINTLLENLGIVNDVIVIDDEPEVNDETVNSSYDPPTALDVSSVKNKTNESWQSARHGDNQLSKFSQTDAPRCIACEKRSKIVTKSTSVQCGDDFMKFSVGTQVGEENFYPTLPKNQSLASLTPAQLLARSVASVSSRNNVDDYDMMFPMKKNRSSGFPNRIIPPQQAPPPPRGLFDSSSMAAAKNKYNYF